MLAGCSPKTAPQRQTSAPAPEVTQFYTNKPLLPKGEKALLCYGVANAAAVRIDPPVEKLAPALTRCFEVTPAQTTKYTLTADGRDGRTASREVTI
ncbi:MAG: hypothetical protein HYS04_08195, partial [Acidobacteria bacterium]|nr:hypothetical protein [Acidobacteriota bacterium]